MALTKDNIVASVHDELGVPKNQATWIVEALLEIMKRTLESGENVLISGFGKFCVKDKRQRRGRNPQTAEEIVLRPRRIVTFRCSGVLRDKINGPKTD
ncbi:MAG: integration host factor subunit alpha [Deltaproteobacteria bacterium]|nr:integration host factor subunit alpha [Deltaproteobacteria bacterium]